MDRPAAHQLTAALARRRGDVLALIAAGVEAVSPRMLMPRVVDALGQTPAPQAAVHVVAVGKAATGMFEVFAAAPPFTIARAVVIAPGRPEGWTSAAAFVEAGHPFATAGSVMAARLALAIAADVPAEGRLVCLLSGGASALMAAPLPGLTLEAKQAAVAHVMTGGADITALNAVRKHLSLVKGGRLAASCRGAVVTYAISDVVGDDLSVIGSGPCVPDGSTWRDAAEAVRRFGGWDGLGPEVQGIIEAGLRGEVADTPGADDPRLARATAEVIGGRRQAMDGVARAAAARGYTPVVLESAVQGEARLSARAWWASAVAAVAGAGRPMAIISSGETTVHVRGHGRGGRNQEFALALVDAVAADGAGMVLASVGSDGIDGPTDAAGALVDAGTRARAAAHGLETGTALDANDSFAFFAAAGDLVMTGPTGTNVGDLQVLLAGPA